MTEPKTTTTHILALASRPEGISSRCIPALTVEDLSARCCALVRDGRLHRGGTGRGNLRYFTDPKAAKAYTDKQQPHILPRPVAPGKASFAKDAKVVITAETKVTICPPWKPRFEAIALPGVMASNQRGRVASEPESHGQPARAPELEAAHG